jgi:hypothetical protein
MVALLAKLLGIMKRPRGSHWPTVAVAVAADTVGASYASDARDVVVVVIVGKDGFGVVVVVVGVSRGQSL